MKSLTTTTQKSLEGWKEMEFSVWVIRVGVFLGIKLNKEGKETRKAGRWGWNTSKFLMLLKQLTFTGQRRKHFILFQPKQFFLSPNSQIAVVTKARLCLIHLNYPSFFELAHQCGCILQHEFNAKKNPYWTALWKPPVTATQAQTSHHSAKEPRPTMTRTQASETGVWHSVVPEVQKFLKCSALPTQPRRGETRTARQHGLAKISRRWHAHIPNPH